MNNELPPSSERGPGGPVRYGVEVSQLPDLSISTGREVLLPDRAIVDIIIELPEGVFPHPSILRHVKEHLKGRVARFWIEDRGLHGNFSISYSTESHEDMALHFALKLNELVGGRLTGFEITPLIPDGTEPPAVS